MKHHERLQKDIARLKEKLVQANSEIRQLRKSLDAANGLLEAVPVAVAVVQDGKIVINNKAAEVGLGVDSGQLQGLSFMDFVHPDCAKEVSAIHHKRSIGKVAPDRYRADLVDKNGRRVLCEVFVRKILHMGRRAFLLGVIECGERALSEAELLRAERVGGALDLARVVTSEAGPLVEMLLDEIGQASGGGAQSDRSQGSAPEPLRRGVQVLRQVEKFSRAAAVGGEKHPRALKNLVQEALEEACIDWRRRTGSENGGPKIQTHLRTDVHVQGNGAHLKEAFAAVIENALEAVGKSGEVHVSMEENLGHAWVYVLDNGPGMSETVRQRVFEPFFTTRDGGRLGMGLPLASNVFNRYGGAIELVSPPGGGTQVVMQLPAVAAPRTLGARACSSRLKGQEVLVCSDDAMIRRLLCEVLNDKGCRVTEASRLQQVLRAPRRGRYDMLVMDADNKEWDPAILLPRLRKKNLGTLLVVLKTKGRQPGQARMKELGADLIAFKPLHLDGLMRAISTSLGREDKQL